MAGGGENGRAGRRSDGDDVVVIAKARGESTMHAARQQV
jgi:hypothetical protein